MAVRISQAGTELQREETICLYGPRSWNVQSPSSEAHWTLEPMLCPTPLGR